MLYYQQLFSIEIGAECNLTKMHPRCPSNLRSKDGQPLTDELILKLVDDAYDLRFRGLFAWHFYNEPALQSQRIFGLMEKIREKHPQSRFLLWTNGTILPRDSKMSYYDQIYCTNYLGVTRYELEQCYGYAKWWGSKADTSLDDRLNPTPEMGTGRCLRPHVEFIIDNFGQAHICCYDWKGLVELGNIWNTPLKTILERREAVLTTITGAQMTEDAPEKCRMCNHRENPLTSNFDPVLFHGIVEKNRLLPEQGTDNV